MLKQNKSFQFLIGCFVLFFIYKLYVFGVFAWFLEDPESEGYQSFELVPLLLTAVVSAVQMVGVIAIMIVSGLSPVIESLVDTLRSKIPKLDAVATKVEETVDFDVKKLTDVLNDIDERIRAIEINLSPKDDE